MATADGTESESTRQMRQVSARLSPLSRFPVPRSDGYSVYSALLSKLSGVDEDVGRSVHESPLGSLHSSGLLGTFGQSDRAYHKTLLPNETYDLSLGIVHPDDTAGRNSEKSRAGIETEHCTKPRLRFVLSQQGEKPSRHRNIRVPRQVTTANRQSNHWNRFNHAASYPR